MLGIKFGVLTLVSLFLFIYADDSLSQGTYFPTRSSSAPIDSSSITNGGIAPGDIRTAAIGSTQIAPTAVTAGSYTNTDLTVDGDGRITTASNGIGLGVGVTPAGARRHTGWTTQTTPVATDTFVTRYRVDAINAELILADVDGDTLRFRPQPSANANVLEYKDGTSVLFSVDSLGNATTANGWSDLGTNVALSTRTDSVTVGTVGGTGARRVHLLSTAAVPHVSLHGGALGTKSLIRFVNDGTGTNATDGMEVGMSNVNIGTSELRLWNYESGSSAGISFGCDNAERMRLYPFFGNFIGGSTSLVANPSGYFTPQRLFHLHNVNASVTSWMITNGSTGTNLTDGIKFEYDNTTFDYTSNNQESNGDFAFLTTGSSSEFRVSPGGAESFVLEGDGDIFLGDNESTGGGQLTIDMDGNGNTKGRAIIDNYHIQTTDATVTTISTISTATDNVYGLFIQVAGIKSDGSQGGHFLRQVSVKNDGGTVSVIGSTTTIGTDAEDDANWNVTATTSGTNILVQVTGVAATTIEWQATITRTVTSI